MTTPDVIQYLRRTRPELTELQRLRVALATMRVIRRVPINRAADALAACMGVQS